MGEGYVHQGSLLAHVVPRRHDLAALAGEDGLTRLRDFGEIWTHLQHGPEPAVDVVPGHRLTITWPLDRRRDATASSAAGAGLRRAVVVIVVGQASCAAVRAVQR